MAQADLSNNSMDPSASANNDWPPLLSRILAAAAGGDPIALRLANEVLPTALKSNDNVPMAARFAQALTTSYRSLNPPADTEHLPAAYFGAGNSLSADPHVHLLIAAYPPEGSDGTMRTEDAFFHLLIAEYLFNAMDLNDEGASVAEKRALLAAELSEERLADVVRRAHRWRAKSGFVAAPPPLVPTDPASRIEGDLARLDEVENRLGRKGKFAETKLLLLNRLMALAPNDKARGKLRRRQAELLLSNSSGDAAPKLAAAINQLI
jgi:hypothetical protein